MRDFKLQGGELANLDWKTLSQKYDHLGCVLNTDVSGGPGEHWTAIFIDFKNGTVEYFDSAAQIPHKEFSDFIIETAHELTKLTSKKYTDVLVTKIEHQKENTECGVYSLYYILSRLHGVKYSAFEFKRVPDDMMVDFRKFLFRHS
jgi:Ulp1 family protease